MICLEVSVSSVIKGLKCTYFILPMVSIISMNHCDDLSGGVCEWRYKGTEVYLLYFAHGIYISMNHGDDLSGGVCE